MAKHFTNHTFLQIVVMLTLWFASASSMSQEVATALSSREAYVDSPLLLQIQVSDVTQYDLPDSFEIAGCDVVAEGTPLQSSQILIVNGRRSETRSVTARYRITPRREGRFRVPPISITIDGKVKKTRPLEFSASRSETGDLMFVEIETGKPQVFVGEPLKLKLNIWVKPYRDEKNRVELTEASMWGCLSGQSSWGPFTERINELAANRQRPEGQRVLREDADGEPAEYYRYALEATVYPKRPGRIDANDVKIVAEYPTALGKSRDPFDSFFDDRGFGGSALMKRMMEDNFGGRSPFGRRLAISKTRPIAAEATVATTEVLPIPTEGRPEHYRGAVGRYRIVTDSGPGEVNAGDPVTLRIGIVGDGPMELVQAPPLHEIENLTKDFKIADEALAGFVQDDSKVFVTTIRPRHPGIAEIPSIPFSFFDPERGEFQTVLSSPLPLTVNAAESLSLDSIVSNTSRSRDVKKRDGTTAAALNAPTAPDFENESSHAILSGSDAGFVPRWVYFAIIPPAIFVALICLKLLLLLLRLTPRLRSAQHRAVRAIRKTHSFADMEISPIVQLYVGRKTGDRIESEQQAAGALRLMGLNDEASELENFFFRLHRSCRASLSGGNAVQLGVEEPIREPHSEFIQEKAIELIAKLENSFSQNRPRTLPHKRSSGLLGRRTRTAMLLIMSCLTATACGHPKFENDDSRNAWSVVLDEADALYKLGQQSRGVDEAEANQAFSAAATKYQWLVEEGAGGAKLQVNLGNAYWQSGHLGLAVAHYQKACRLDPALAAARKNLRLARQKVESNQDSTEKSSGAFTLRKSMGWLLQQVASGTLQVLGWQGTEFLFAVSSMLFWTLLIAKVFRLPGPLLRVAFLIMLPLVISGWSLLEFEINQSNVAIIVNDSVELRAGDGDEFEATKTLESAEGVSLRLLDERGKWVHVSGPRMNGTGWTLRSNVEVVYQHTPILDLFRPWLR